MKRKKKINTKKYPVRTCIICGAKRDKDELMRLVCRNKIIIDPLARKGGRGRYICKNSICIDRLGDAKALRRSFRTNDIDKNDALFLIEQLNSVMNRDAAASAAL